MKDSTSALFIGGSPWIDLVNTVYISRGEEVDLLAAESTAADWLISLDVDKRMDEREVRQALDAGLLVQLQACRDICRSLLQQITTAPELPLPDLEKVKHWLESLELKVEIEYGVGKQPQELYKGADLAQNILYQIGISVIRTLQKIPLERLRKCRHEECVRYFVDTSKSGKRAWCSMEACGNREKAAKFYARKR